MPRNQLWESLDDKERERQLELARRRALAQGLEQDSYYQVREKLYKAVDEVAVEALIDVAQNDDKGSARVAASVALLDRTGHPKVTKVEKDKPVQMDAVLSAAITELAELPENTLISILRAITDCKPGLMEKLIQPQIEGELVEAIEVQPEVALPVEQERLPSNAELLKSFQFTLSGKRKNDIHSKEEHEDE